MTGAEAASSRAFGIAHTMQTEAAFPELYEKYGKIYGAESYAQRMRSTGQPRLIFSKVSERMVFRSSVSQSENATVSKA